MGMYFHLGVPWHPYQQTLGLWPWLAALADSRAGESLSPAVSFVPIQDEGAGAERFCGTWGFSKLAPGRKKGKASLWFSLERQPKRVP